MRWDAFERACPHLASMARERFLRDDLVLVGTLHDADPGAVRLVRRLRHPG